jgi:hypothetical protein
MVLKEAMMKDDRNGKSKIYRTWQCAVFARDKCECQHCGSSQKLHAHHIIGWNENESLRYEVSNGLTLCSGCHTRLHSVGRKGWNKGKKLSEEGRKKLSDAHKGQKPWNKGLKMSKEFCDKASEVRVGVKRGAFSEEHKRKIGIANKDTLKKNSALRKGKTWTKCQETGKRIWIINE